MYYNFENMSNVTLKTGTLTSFEYYILIMYHNNVRKLWPSKAAVSTYDFINILFLIINFTCYINGIIPVLN